MLPANTDLLFTDTRLYVHSCFVRAMQVLRNGFFQGILPPPTPRNANNVE